MRLAYVHYLCSGAAGLNHVNQFAEAARSLGHEVDLFAMNLAPQSTSNAKPKRVTSKLRHIAKRHFRRYLHEPKELLWNLRYVRREISLLRNLHPDVLLVRDHLLTASCVSVARRLRLPLVIEINAPAAESRLYFDEYAHIPVLPERLEAWKLRHADAVTVVSSAMLDHLVKSHRLPKEKFTVVPNGADPAVFSKDAPRDPEIGKRLGPRTVIGFVGSFQKFHGSDRLVKMIERVGNARPSTAFLLVGDGPAAGEVRQLADRLGDRFVFLGRVAHQRIPSLVACLDVGVMPESNFYGSPLKVFEWMAAGKAVVAPAYGPLKEVLEHGKEGLLFPPGDTDALVNCVLRLIDDPALAKRLGEAAPERIRSSLTWRHNAKRVITACETAVREHARRG